MWAIVCRLKCNFEIYRHGILNLSVLRVEFDRTDEITTRHIECAQPIKRNPQAIILDGSRVVDI